MNKQLFIVLILLLTTGCTNTALKLNKATVLSGHKTTENSEELFQLVGIDGKYFKGNKVNSGPHTFYIRGLQATQDEKQKVNESMHSLRVKLHENSVYQVMSESNDEAIKVWLEDQENGNIVSDVSTLLVKNIKVIELDKVIPDKTERIRVFGKKSHFKFTIKPGGACQFKNAQGANNRGFEESITDRKMPTRFYVGRNC